MKLLASLSDYIQQMVFAKVKRSSPSKLPFSTALGVAVKTQHSPITLQARRPNRFSP
jgi:hypothetical protein